MTDALVAVIAGGPSTAGITEQTRSDACGGGEGFTKSADVAFIFIAVSIGDLKYPIGLSKRRPRNNDG